MPPVAAAVRLLLQRLLLQRLLLQRLLLVGAALTAALTWLLRQCGVERRELAAVILGCAHASAD